MNSLALACNIRALNARWRAFLDDSSSETAGHESDDILQNISDGIARCTRELQGRWSWDLTAESLAEGHGDLGRRGAAALRETILSKEGLIGTAAAAVLQKANTQVTLKKQVLELCRLVVLSDDQFATSQDFEEVVVSCALRTGIQRAARRVAWQ